MACLRTLKLHDTTLAVYTGSRVGSLTTVASNDDSSACGLQSSVSFAATAGTTYHFQVDGYWDTGTVDINLSEAPCAGTGPKVLVMGAEDASWTADVVAKLCGTGQFSEMIESTGPNVLM